MTRSLLFAIALAGCQTAAFDDPMHASGSRTIAVTAEGDRSLALNVEEGSLTVVHQGSTADNPVDIGLEPTRIARHGDRFLVTLRGEGALAVVEWVDGEAMVTDRLPLGSEPFGLVVTEAGDLFVALSGEDQVVGLDADTLVEFGRWSVPDEPRWIAAGTRGKVYVGSVKNASLHQIDVDSGEVTAIALPQVTRSLDSGEVTPLTNRITGDLSVSPDGHFLAVPVLSVDNSTSGNGRNPNADTSYNSESPGPGRFNPGVALVGIRPNGNAAIPLTILSAATEELSFERFASARSFPSAAIFGPGGDSILVPMEGSHLISVLDLTEDAHDEGLTSPRLFQEHGFSTPRTSPVQAPAGARSLAFVDEDTVIVHGWLDRAVGQVDGISRASEFGASTAAPVALEVSRFSVSVERGRHAFNTATNRSMQAAGSGVTCATCHFDGREDGLTWALEDGPRQTMSLGGVLSDTLPITWDGSVQQVTTEVILTSGNRMGGEGADPQLAADVAAYIDITRTGLPSWSLDGDAIARGEAIFQREEVGCAECHPAPSFTDAQNHAIVAGFAVNTPTLRGIASSGPYLHDGSAADLDAVLSMARIGQMGDISSLDDGEIEDLRAYLLSL